MERGNRNKIETVEGIKETKDGEGITETWRRRDNRNMEEKG